MGHGLAPYSPAQIITRALALLLCALVCACAEGSAGNTKDEGPATSPEGGGFDMKDGEVPPGNMDGSTPADEGGAQPPPQGIVELERSCDAELTLKLSVLNDHSVRLRFVRGGTPQVDRGWTHDLEAFKGPTQVTVNDDAGVLNVRTAALTITVPAGGCLPVIEDLMGRKVWTTVSPADASDGKVSVARGLVQGERIFGLGEKTGKADRRGRVLTNWNSDPAWSDPEGRYRPVTDPIYQSHPFFMSVHKGKASGAYLANTHRSVFDLGKTDTSKLAISAEGGEIDLFVFEGPTPARVLERYSALVGRTELPPLWALGYHQARWSYTPDTRITAVAAQFRTRKLPADGIWLDIDYMDGYRSFTWHKADFTNPKKLISDLEATGFKATAILDPGIKYDPDNGYDAFDRGIAQGAFILGADGKPVQRRCWPQWAVFPDYSAEKGRKWWADELGLFFEGSGMRGIWIDMNEPAVFHPEGFPLDAPVDGEGTPTTFAEIRNVYAHLMAQATHEGSLAKYPDRRPFILTRAGFSGTQKYAAVWTGDAESEWESLDIVPAQLQGMSLSGIPFIGSDVGGFTGAKSPEMYARWFELGTFSPFFRSHVATGKPDQEPWSFGAEVENAARKLLTLRYALLPYWYQLFVQAQETGAPTLRPIWWDKPDDAASFAHEHEFFVGPSLLVAPVTTPGASTRSVYLPPGTFVDYHTGSRHAGTSTVDVPAPYGRVPMFVRAGAIMPAWGPRQYVGEDVDDTLFLDVYAGPVGTRGELSYYEDDGASMAYKTGAFSRTPMVYEVSSTGSELRLEARTGSYKPEARKIGVRLHGINAAPSVAKVDGQDATVRWDAATRTALITFADTASARTVTFVHGTEAPTTKPAELTFTVTVPTNTPAGDIYLAANSAGWTPNGVRLTRSGDTAMGILSVPAGSVVEYKVTRGTWATVEKSAACQEVVNRVVTTTDQAQSVALTVARWGDSCP